MTPLESVLRRTVADLALAGADCALVGGLAISVRTEPRFTRDADLVVAVPGDVEAEALIRLFRELGYHVTALIEQDAVKRLATVRLQPDTDAGAPVVDLLFASSGIEAEIVHDAEILEVLPGLLVRVARPGHLIALKLLSRDDVQRPQDIGDLRALLRSASREELTRARNAVEAIAARGYHRGRNLTTDLDDAIALMEPRRDP